MTPASLQSGLWVPAEKSDCYRKVQINVVSASQIVRQITIPNAFVVGYEEDLRMRTEQALSAF